MPAPNAAANAGLATTSSAAASSAGRRVTSPGERSTTPVREALRDLLSHLVLRERRDGAVRERAPRSRIAERAYSAITAATMQTAETSRVTRRRRWPMRAR